MDKAIAPTCWAFEVRIPEGESRVETIDRFRTRPTRCRLLHVKDRGEEGGHAGPPVGCGSVPRVIAAQCLNRDGFQDRRLRPLGHPPEVRVYARSPRRPESDVSAIDRWST